MTKNLTAQYGIERLQHARVVRDADQAEHGEHGEPDAHDRAEQGSHAARAGLLDDEEDGDDQHGGGNHIRLEHRSDHLQAFHRRQHRDRGRDHAVAIEQRRAEHAQRQQQPVQPVVAVEVRGAPAPSAP